MLIARRLVGLGLFAMAVPPHRRAGAYDLSFDVTFRADVNEDTCSHLKAAIKERVRERTTLLAQLGAENVAVPPIHLHVTSRGGSLIAGLQAYDYLSTVDGLHTHVDGIVASAATLLTVAGDRRYMTRHSMLLVHQPSLYLEDDMKATDLRDQTINMQKLVSNLLDIYNATTQLDIDSLTQMIQNEQILTSQEALQYGFVDEIE